MPVRRLAAFTGVAVLVLGVGTAVAAEPDPTYPTGTFTITQPGILSGYGGCYDDLYASGTIAVASLVDDNTPTDRIRLKLDLPGVWWLDPYGAPVGETKGIDGWWVTFASTGTFVPTVTITDQDNHQTVVTLPAITVVDDTTGPSVSITQPAAGSRASVRAWRVLRGKAVDAETGIFEVNAQVLQRRAGTWYAYDDRARKWRKGTRSEAWTRNHFRPQMTTQRVVDGRWAMPALAGLTKGLLSVRADAMHNGSCRTATAPEIRVQLTRR